MVPSHELNAQNHFRTFEVPEQMARHYLAPALALILFVWLAAMWREAIPYAWIRLPAGSAPRLVERFLDQA